MYVTTSTSTQMTSQYTQYTIVVDGERSEPRRVAVYLFSSGLFHCYPTKGHIRIRSVLGSLIKVFVASGSIAALLGSAHVRVHSGDVVNRRLHDMAPSKNMSKSENWSARGLLMIFD